MNSKKQKEVKGFSFKRFLNSIKYSLEGLYYAYRNEQSLWIHGVCTILIILLGFALKISFGEWAIVLIADIVVLAVELLNTAIEAVVDLVTSKIHPLAKVAKDCGSAASFVSAIVLIIICLFVFIPKIIALV